MKIIFYIILPFRLNVITLQRNQKISRKMRSTNYYTQILQKYMTENSSRYGITRMGIFGSVARGEQRDNSDVDVCVEGDLKGMFALSGIKTELEAILGCPVDVVRLREKMDSFFRNEILKDVIYV